MNTKSLFVALILALGCERGEVISGSFQIICGPERRPCNFHIVAPIELRQGAVSIDNEGALQLFPESVEHPIRSLLSDLVGVEPTSDKVVLTCHLPAGSHLIRISKMGWQVIEHNVTGPPAGEKAELVIREDELRRTDAESR